METRAKPRMTQEEVQRIIDNRLAIIIEKEIMQEMSEKEKKTEKNNQEK